MLTADWVKADLILVAQGLTWIEDRESFSFLQNQFLVPLNTIGSKSREGEV